jgi:hypothetical protein
METQTAVILFVVFLLVGSSLGVVYFKNRHLVKAQYKGKQKKRREFWSLE